MWRSLPIARTTTSPACSPTRICTGTPWLRCTSAAYCFTMVFMSDGGTKQRHDAVAHDLVHRALVAVHRGHHVFQDGVEELPGFLGIALGQEFHRAFEVGKQHRDVFAFAFEGTPGS